MRLKWVRYILCIVGVLLGLIFLAESLLQPKVRAVPLEGVPTTADTPDATFMIGATMNPPVQTNPFLVIFSPLEGVVKQIQVVPGSLHALTDSASIFIWEVCGIRTVWHLSRHSHEIAPLFILSPRLGPHVCVRLFPVLSAFLRTKPEFEIRKSQNPGHVVVGRKNSDWVEAEVNPEKMAVWAVRAVAPPSP